jgi:glycerol-3-phosphate dehydrogenase
VNAFPADAHYDVVVIGAGIVGAAIARALSQHDLSVAIVESGADVGAGTSKANTAILHTGFDAKPGTLEAGLVARGHALLGEYANTAGIAVERTGAFVVAWSDEQRERLSGLSEQAARNGYDRSRIINDSELYRREPRLGTGARGALEIPDESIIDPWSPSIAFATDAVRDGAVLLREAAVIGVDSADPEWSLSTARGRIFSRFVVNAAGVRSDLIDEFFGHADFTVTPRRGQLIVFDKLARDLVAHILLPVPSATTKGVLVSPTVFGNVVLGPTAEDLDDKDDTSSTRAGIDALLEQGGRILPALVREEVTAVYAGLRAATEHTDYQITAHEGERFVTVGGIRSTGLTASLAIAEHVVELLVAAGLSLRGERRAGASAVMPPLGEATIRAFADPDRIASDPDYGRIVCHCERVTRAEIRDACASTIAPADLDGLRRRTRVVMGRCQGFACLADVTALLSESNGRERAAATRSPASARDRHDECDVLVIGGGPAGLATATALRGLGAGRVVLVEREAEPGGIARHSDHTGYGLRDLHRILRGPAYARAWTARAERSGVEIRTEASVTGWRGPASARTVEITSPSGRGIVGARAVVLATGCRERPRSARLVPGSRPAGVLTTGALQRLVGRGLPVGTRAVVVGAEHVSYSAALTLRHAGVSVVAMVASGPEHESFAAFAWTARSVLRIPLRVGSALTRILGRARVEAVEVTDLARGTTEIVECDTVVFTGDWFPDNELARRGGLSIDPGTVAPHVDARLRTSVPGVFAAGNLLHGAETADVCALDGRWVAESVAQWLSNPSWSAAGIAIQPIAPLRWTSPNAFAAGQERLPHGRLLVSSAVFAPKATVEARQTDTVLWSGRTNLVPARTFAIRDGWSTRVDPDGGPVTITTDA